MNQLQNALETTLKSPEKKLAYHLSDGKQASTKVAELSKVGSDFKVRSLWKEWRGKGLGDMVAVKGGDRFKRAFDLEDFGIEVPKMPQTPQAMTAQSSTTNPEGVSGA